MTGRDASPSPEQPNLKNYHDGGEAILEAFRSLNVKYVISSPGSEWPSLWEALARQKHNGTPGPTYLDCGHETLAVAMTAGSHLVLHDEWLSQLILQRLCNEARRGV